MTKVELPRFKLGNTDLELPVLGFGASGLGSIYGVNITKGMPFK